jgi:cytoskeletal protein CcmA (bactofilin family)
MWTKDRRDGQVETPGAPREIREPEPRVERREQNRPVGPAMIGRSIAIKGEVTGDEDMVIQGRVEGSVDLKQHSVTVGPEGEVKANITARVVTVEGRVDGNLSGEEQVILRSSARVKGDIVAPRVVLEDGTVFRGSVEMGDAARAQRAAAPAAGPAAKPPKGSENAQNAQKAHEGDKRVANPGDEQGKGRPAPAVAEVRG